MERAMDGVQRDMANLEERLESASRTERRSRERLGCAHNFMT